MAIDWEYYKKKAKKIDEENYRKNTSNQIEPIHTQTTPAKTKETTYPKWFQKSELFNDGWDFGDVFKTIIGSGTDVTEHAGAGLIGSGEKILDALSRLGTAMNGQALHQAAENEMIYNTIAGNDISGEQVLKKYKEIQKSVEKGSEEFIKKDLYDEQRIAKKLISDPMREKHGIDAEADSIFGEKSDELAYSGGQLLGTAVASKLGVPSSVLIGLTSFGGEMESALNQGATYDEASFSSAVSAGAEILTEKISGGIKFGGKTLDEALTKKITSSISKGVARKLVSLGMDAAGEGFEEVLSGAMSAVGQKLSYADDKKLNELFSSQDAWDSFIGGAILGGLSSAGKNVKSKIKGIDSVTGLTNTEQAVFDKVYNDRIAEATKDGKKLSAKDKSNIYNSVMDDIEKGRISIDTIESVLGGDTYKQYQSAVEKDNQMKELQKEYDSLYQMKSGDKSDAQSDHQAELKQQLEDYKNNSQLTQLKDKLSKEVSEMAKVSKLSESYNEKSRRSQAFEADLTQYDEKHQGTYKRAIESGILNNTNRTHEFVDLLAKLEADKGVLFDFTNNAKIKETGFAIEGKQVNGYVQGNSIAINIDSTSALNKVVGHEIAHVLEGTELYTELANAVKELATTKGEYDSKLQSISKLYEGVEDANIENEITADLIGEYLFTDSEFINKLSAEKPTLFQKIFDEIKYLCKVAAAGSKEARQLEKVKKAFEDAYKQKNNTATDDGVKYSMAGVQSKTADNSLLLKAEQMLESGIDSESVRQETGWYKGYDGEWRYEIDDSKMALIRQGSEIINYGMLDELISHDELFEAYPHLRYMGVIFQDLGGKLGSYSRQFGDINIDSSLKNNPEELKNVLIHEIQHAIQDIEGLTHGSSPLYWEEQLKNNSDIGKTAEQKHELEELETKYREIENNNPDFFNEMIELAEMVPNIPRGKMDWDTLEQIEEDPTEWQRYDEKRNALSEKYSESQVIDFMLLQDKIQRIKASGRTARDLYWDTAGEIEARDTTKRLNLNSEQRKNTRPDIDRKDVVFADDSDASWMSAKDAMYDSETSSVVEQIKNSQAILNELDVVGEAIVPENIKTKYDAAQWAISNLKMYGYQVDRQNFGKIYFNEKDIRKGAEYADTDVEKGAFVLIPKVLKRGIEIGHHGNHKLRQKETVTFAAPVVLNGTRGNMAVVVNLNGNRYLVHRIILPDGTTFKFAEKNKEVKQESYQGVTENSSLADTTSFTSNNSVPQENTTVNNNSMQEKRKNSLSNTNEDIAPAGNNVYGEDIKLQSASAEDLAPIGENVVRKKTPSESNIPDDYAPTADDIQKQDTPKIDLFVKSNKTVESEQATVLKETTPVEQSTIDEKAVERLTRKVIDGLDIGKTKKNRTAIGEIIKSFGDNYSATSKDALYDAVKEKFGTTYVDSVINKATDLIYNNVTEHREATSKVDKVTKDIESANISNKVKTEIKNQLTSAYEKIEAEYNIDKNNLVNELNARKSQLETDTADKNHFFKKYAGELYSELKQLKKGVRASEDLSYLLNSLDSKNWKPLVTALINAKNAPEGVVNENSEIERVVRELLNEKFDSYVDELNNFDSTAQEELEKLETKAEDKRNYARLAVNGKLVREIMDAEQVSLMGDTSTWKDKKKGFWYKTETEKRNFEDIVKDSKGKADMEKAKALNDYFMGTYNHNEAELKRESNKIKKDFIDLKLNKHEDVFVQMKGEFLHNPHTELTQHDIDTFLNLYGKNIDEAKVDKAIDMARETYDSLIERMNEVLVAHGMKPIEYRRGYFPHFSEVEKSKFAKFAEKFLNWKTQNNDIPTDIAGLTESFKPNRSWQSFNKRRISDETDYSFSKGFDRYLQGSLDWIYHIDDIMKRRVFENRIRYDHSDNGIKEQIQEIYKNNEFDTNEKQEQIDLVFREAQNPLNNFIIDFRTRTNTLAGKKSSMDRGMEEFTSRKFYSTMNNISNRVTANMVAGSISSALTNFIPITQSWGEVSPISSLRAMSDTIRSAIKDDGVVDKSDFLTNRLKNPENLYQTGWDKVNEAAGLLMEVVDGFTSQTVWRSKYLENLSKGMSEAESIKNADEFAEGLIAGRSRGNMPTIFDAKNPIAKTLTAFQLEVNNQYRYLFKDMPKNLADESKTKLAKGYAAVFIGAHVYNMEYSALVGRNAAFDPIDIIKELVGDLFDDEEEELGENIGNAVLSFAGNVLDETPFVGGIFGDGGRIPLSSALPYGDGIWNAFEGTVTDLSEGDLENLTKEWLSSVGAYVLAPVAGGQIKKTVQGLSMFDDDFPIAGSYTDSGKLRFSVEKTPGNIAQAALFGQYASKTAQQYFDEEHAPLSDKQTEELSALEISMEEYWNYQKGLKKLGDDATLAEQVDFIANLEEFDTWQKNIMANSLTDRKTPIDLTGYEAIGDFEEFDYSIKHPEKYAIAKAVGGYDSYIKYSEHLGNITAEKDRNGKTVSGSRKKKVARYINNLDIEFGEKMILYKSEYKGDDIYNAQIVEYLNGRNDITYQEKITILTELGFNVLSDGTVRW